MTDSTSARLHAAEAVLAHVAARDDDLGHTLIRLPVDDVLDMPTEVQAYAEGRFQAGPTSSASVGLPAAVLARYALGWPIPKDF